MGLHEVDGRACEASERAPMGIARQVIECFQAQTPKTRIFVQLTQVLETTHMLTSRVDLNSLHPDIHSWSDLGIADHA